MQSPTSCDVLIIGAGIAGVSLAHELAKLGKEVIVVEATQVCGGSSGLNGGGVRQQFSSPLNIELARRTVKYLEAATERGVLNCDYHQTGYMFIARNEFTADGLKQGIAIQNSFDVPTRWLSPQEILEVAPGVNLDGMLGAALGPTDGYLDPNSLVHHIANQARESGAHIVSGSPVISMESKGNKVTQVTLENGTSFSADTIVNCAGAWAPEIAKLYGANLPIKPWRSQLFVIDGVDTVPVDSPFVIDFDNRKTFYHPEGRTSRLIGSMDAGSQVETSWNLAGDQSIVEDLVTRLMTLNPDFENASISSSWAGMLEITADENPIADWTHMDNVYTMAGFSGHGLPIAPSLAVQVAQVLTSGESELDLTPYAFSRFDESGFAPPIEIMSMR